MAPLLDVIETGPPVDVTVPGRYDPRRGLRVDEQDRPVVTGAGRSLGTETRRGRDTDEAPLAPITALGTVTKAEGDRDDPAVLLTTRSAGGRDVDEDGANAPSALVGTVTFAGPDRD